MTRKEIDTLAQQSFVPTTREQAIAQCVSVALERRGHRLGGLSRMVARKAIRKAKRLKTATDWQAEMFAEM